MRQFHRLQLEVCKLEDYYIPGRYVQGTSHLTLFDIRGFVNWPSTQFCNMRLLYIHYTPQIHEHTACTCLRFLSCIHSCIHMQSLWCCQLQRLNWRDSLHKPQGPIPLYRCLYHTACMGLHLSLCTRRCRYRHQAIC